MKIALVHNPTAGGGHDVSDLVKLLTDAGHEVRHRSSSGDWKSLLQDSGDLVVAAGGDGTVRKVALAAADRGIPFAVLPIGTANNIGKTLGMLGDARELVGGWSADPPPRRTLDLGVLKAENRTERFVESVGGGPVAELIGRGEEIGEQSKLLGRETDQALHLLTELLLAATPFAWRISADGEDLAGEYLAVEVLNIRFTGPNVPLAPEADPSDGLLDVVVIVEEDREPMLAYLENRLNLASGTMPPLRTVRASHVDVVAPAGVRLHLDDGAWPSGGPLADPMRLKLRCLRGAVDLLG